MICIALWVMLQYSLTVKTSRLRSVRGADQGGGTALAEAILPDGLPAAKVQPAFAIQGKDVSTEARGCDLLSRGPDEEVRYIEVKGRAGVGAVEISENEWLKAEQLGRASQQPCAIRIIVIHEEVGDPGRDLGAGRRFGGRSLTC